MPEPRRRSPVVLLLKLVVLLVGLAGVVLCLMALVGALTDWLWVRVSVALLVAILVPAVIADRLLPETGPKPGGLVTAVFALAWFGFVGLFVFLGGDPGRALLAAEGDRLGTDGGRVLADADALGVPDVIDTSQYG